MTSCTSMYPQLVKATLVSGMMPQLAKVFIAVQGQKFITHFTRRKFLSLLLHLSLKKKWKSFEMYRLMF